jgi:hypothetical protein
MSITKYTYTGMQTERKDITGNSTYEIQGTVCVDLEQIKIRSCMPCKQEEEEQAWGM